MDFRLFIVTVTLALGACAHRPDLRAPVTQKVPRLETVRYNADSTLRLDLVGGHPHFRYELKELENGKILGRAESAIGIDDFSDGEFRGEQTVSFSTDNRTICVVEDVSSACPAKRYILFRKTPSGRYATRYLHPPLDPDPSIGTFEGDYPKVIAVTSETITFSRAVGSPSPQRIDSVPIFPNAKTAIY